MASLTNNPYKHFKRAAKGKKLDGNEVHEMMKRKGSKVGAIKHSGTFGGKSNALGHGGRAAQLTARGVPGGVIGNMARSVGAAPGGPNYHGKKKRKAPAPPQQDLGLAMKKKRKGRKEPTVGFQNVERKRKAGSTVNMGDDVEMKSKACAKCKAAHVLHKGKSKKG